MSTAREQPVKEGHDSAFTEGDLCEIFEEASISFDHDLDLANVEKKTQDLDAENPSLDGNGYFDDLELDNWDGADDTSQSPLSTTAKQSRWKSALEKTTHVAGGLIPHPVESKKTYSILRHSTGLVLYRGASTSVAITIFSDEPLPPERTLWLQRKGWTGRTGLKANTLLGRSGNWIEVTPAREVLASQISQTDERAWQRDIEKFLRKASKSKGFTKRRPRETSIVRVPVASNDGYFRLLLCSGEGKKVLCPSPVFRVASVSTSSSSFKGASLSTLPVEFGVKAISAVGMNAAGNVAAPVISAVQSRIGQYLPGRVTQTATQTAYDMSGAQQKMNSINENFNRQREVSFDVLDAEGLESIIGDDSGPSAPFPLQFHAKVVSGMGKSKAETGVPTAKLSGVREDYKARLLGIYFGWASITKAKTELLSGWEAAIVIATPRELVAGVVPKKDINVYIVYDFGEMEFFNAKISLIIMGFIRPWIPCDDPDAFFHQTYTDIAVARQSLARPVWAAEATIERVKVGRNATNRLADAREFGQRQFDRLPFDKVSVRTPTAGFKDKALGAGGLYIKR